MSTLTPRQRIRNVALLCSHATRNIAYLRALHERAMAQGQFWKTVDGNFVDIAALEWCKLFVDGSGKHHWQKVIDVTQHQAFLPAVFVHAGIDQQKFQDCFDRVKTYRDKFVAHLDNETVMNIPTMDIVLKSVEHLYSVIRTSNPMWFNGLPPNMPAYYQQCEQEANDAWGEE